ncbi:MAG: AraC family transcriptional regulator [Oscillospiraceae bacterium]|nr:AraC family transcriptional regulator [Oscillospiraceae bacterium]
MGDVYRSQIASLTLSLSGESFTFIRYTPRGFCCRGWDSRRHSNIRDEVHIILSGSCGLDVEGDRYDLSPGDAFVVRKGQYHAPCNATEDVERCSFMLDVVPGGFLDRQLQRLSGRSFHLSGESVDLCRSLNGELDDRVPYYADMVRAKLTQLMVDILRQAEPEEVPDVDTSRTPKQALLIGIDQFFSPWPNALGTEADLARQLNISRHKLNRIIWQYYGMSFREKLHLAKMDYAAWILRVTDFPCHKVATLCGYSADTSFYRAFAAHFGIPPQAYRKEQKKKGIDRLDLSDGG